LNIVPSSGFSAIGGYWEAIRGIGVFGLDSGYFRDAEIPE
jgi:hypothetical protein